jgi:hypothetical protein
MRERSGPSRTARSKHFTDYVGSWQTSFYISFIYLVKRFSKVCYRSQMA